MIHNFLFISIFLRESLLDPDRGYKGERVEGLDFFVEHLTWKKLPKEVFECYGGYEQAKQMREELGFNKRVTFEASAAVKNEGEGAAVPTVETDQKVDSKTTKSEGTDKRKNNYWFKLTCFSYENCIEHQLWHGCI